MNTVELHTIPLKQDANKVAQLRQTLSDKEIERANRFLFVEHQRRFIVAHGMMRQILSEYIGSSPESVRLGTNSNGKPILMQSNHRDTWSFSLSYSADLAVLAICRGAEIGVDIEWRRLDRSFLEMARRYFFPGETHYLFGLQGDRLVEEFYRIWTLKESWLKAIGVGLAGLEIIEIVPDRDHCFDVRIHHKNLLNTIVIPTDTFQWRFFDTLPGYTGCYTRLNSSQTVSTI